MDQLRAHIATIVVGLIGGYLAQFLQPRSKLICWSPHNFFFDLKPEAVKLQTNSMTLRNVGRLPAEEIQIIHQQKPDFFELYPSLDYEESITPAGEHVIRIKSLGPKEWVMLQMLNYRNAPIPKNVRWKHGQAKWVQIQPQRVIPNWVVFAAQCLMLIGGSTIIYFVIRAGYAVALQFGLLAP